MSNSSVIKLLENEDLLREYINNAKNTIRLLITKKCNSKCIYCYEEGMVGFTNKQLQCLDLNDFKNIIIAAKLNGVKRISISGGEPTLCYDWVEELVRLCDEQELLVYITTNATNKKIIELAKKYPKLELRISLDCSSKEEYKYFRGIDLFDQVIETIRQLSELENEIHINRVVVSTDNEWENFNKMIDMIIKNGLNKKKNLFLRMIPCYPNKISDELKALDYIKYLSKYIPELNAKIYQKKLQFVYEFNYKGVKSIVRTRGIFSPKCCVANKNRCVEGIGYTRINPNGLIQPCFKVFLNKIEHGDSVDVIKEKLSESAIFLDNLYVDNYDTDELTNYLLS